MTTYQVSIVAGVFDDENKARHAIEELRKAHFERDQIGVAMRTSGPAVANLRQDLMNLGVPAERASYYDDACREGNIVISVRPDGREQEVRRILDENGAQDYQEGQSGRNAPSQPAQNWTPQGQPVNEAATADYGQQDYHRDLPQ